MSYLLHQRKKVVKPKVTNVCGTKATYIILFRNVSSILSLIRDLPNCRATLLTQVVSCLHWGSRDGK